MPILTRALNEGSNLDFSIDRLRPRFRDCRPSGSLNLESRALGIGLNASNSDALQPVVELTLLGIHSFIESAKRLVARCTPPTLYSTRTPRSLIRFVSHPPRLSSIPLSHSPGSLTRRRPRPRHPPQQAPGTMAPLRISRYKAGLIFSMILTALPGIWAMIA